LQLDNEINEVNDYRNAMRGLRSREKKEIKTELIFVDFSKLLFMF
jgi:hypothetical protein